MIRETNESSVMRALIRSLLGATVIILLFIFYKLSKFEQLRESLQNLTCLGKSEHVLGMSGHLGKSSHIQDRAIHYLYCIAHPAGHSAISH